jgi:hypothetical protein
MIQIPIRLPWSFEDALGYPKAFRWVAFYWEPAGDELMYDDGYMSAEGNWWGFLQFVNHPKVAPWLSNYNLGSSEEEATHWLLCDLEERDVFVGERAEVRAFLANEIKKYIPEVPESKVELLPGEMKEILTKLDEMRQAPPPSVEEIEEKMRKEQEAVEKMVKDLNEGNSMPV